MYPTYTQTFTEDGLKEALQYYLLHKYNQDVSITSIEHNIKIEHERFLGGKLKVPKWKGLTIKVQTGE